MRKLTLLLAVGSLWLFLAALPVLADGGPHVSATNSGVSTLTADSCAGCHRAHTAQGEYLINQATEEDLCLGCHGASSTGATTDVMTGVQYAISGGGLRDTGTTIGALRNGGFDQARIGDVGRLHPTIGTGTVRFKSKVVVDGTLGADNDVTSAHIAMTDNGLTNPGIAWGSGTNGSGVGEASVTLSCASCHNPHGNGQYRILNPTPNAGAIAFQAYGIAKIDGTSDTVFTTTGHEFSVGDVVKFTGVGALAATSYTVVAVPNGVQFQLGTLANPVVVTDLADAGATGTVSRYQAVVTDAPLGTAVNGVYPLRNYSVLQVKGTQGTDSTYMLYAQNVLDARNSVGGWVAGDYSATGGDYWHRQVPWNVISGSADDAPNGQPATNPTTAVGDVAFNVQITAWCTSCHTRYYANQNPNPDGTWDGSSPASSRTITTAAANVLTTSASHGFQVDDVVTVAGLGGVVNGNYTVATVPTATTFTLAGQTPTDGTGLTATAIRFSDPQSASSWWFPRTDAAGAEDGIYKYQHRTVPNRACTTCHVAHGSNRDMTGTFSSTFTRPDGIADDSSRLLKVDDRGTCQACHDPTGTWLTLNPAGTYQGAAGGNVVP